MVSREFHVYDDDGYIGLVNVGSYASFVDSDWELYQLFNHFSKLFCDLHSGKKHLSMMFFGIPVFNPEKKHMILSSQALNDLEQNTALKKNYATAGSWGQNKLMFLPIVILVFSAFALYFFYDLSKRDASYATYSMVCGALILGSIVAIALMQKSAKKKILENIASVPVCIAKKVYGNDDTGVYYCIYTPGSKRHDIAFIDAIADKIFNIDGEPDVQLRKRSLNCLR